MHTDFDNSGNVNWWIDLGNCWKRLDIFSFYKTSKFNVINGDNFENGYGFLYDKDYWGI